MIHTCAPPRSDRFRAGGGRPLTGYGVLFGNKSVAQPLWHEADEIPHDFQNLPAILVHEFGT